MGVFVGAEGAGGVWARIGSLYIHSKHLEIPAQETGGGSVGGAFGSNQTTLILLKPSQNTPIKLLHYFSNPAKTSPNESRSVPMKVLVSAVWLGTTLLLLLKTSQSVPIRVWEGLRMHWELIKLLY